MITVLIIDDEQRMLDLLSLYLTPLGYKCIKVNSAVDALIYLESNQVDIILLDIMMPDMNGWEACEKIRKTSSIPIIMLTARSEKSDIVKGLNIGADDYVMKPFDDTELVARIEAVLRRGKTEEEINELSFKGLSLIKDSFEALYKNIKIELTPKEFYMVDLFLNNQNRVFSREHLISKIWGYDVFIDDRTIDSHVRNIRKKLRDADFPADDYLHTVWGVGYKWTSDKNKS
ncbi:response regulator transcription factor [Paenibacillus provencensis]|uniref:Response regulator transcription factor n=1 Tax=Paenibacillus provencensis TaxID=441151 RepID=A0ABW3PXG9_9BACL